MATNPVTGLVNDLTSGVSSSLGTLTSNLSSLADTLTDPSKLLSQARKQILPLGGSAFSALAVKFIGPGNDDDWRVRLSIPFDFFMGSAVLAPLMDAGGFVFPYTPSISISHSASYEPMSPTHQNFQFLSYQNSKVNDITITGEFYVEDASQALYWIAAVHFLRSVTKMYTSDTNSAGSPPPILSLNAYGDFVFKNVPVVVTSFSVSMDKDCDYISTEPPSGLNLSSVGSIVGVASNTNLIGSAVSGLFNNKAHVPTKSSITVTLSPIYSRESARQFSLQTFVSGGYLTGGYI